MANTQNVSADKSSSRFAGLLTKYTYRARLWGKACYLEYSEKLFFIIAARLQIIVSSLHLQAASKALPMNWQWLCEVPAGHR